MLDLKFVRDNLDVVRKALDDKGEEAAIDQFAEVDEKRRSLLHEVEQLKQKRNKVSEQVAQMKRSGEDASGVIEEMRAVSQKIKEMDNDVRNVDDELQQILLTLPNIPHKDVPVGQTEEENVAVRHFGEPTTFDFEAKPHWDIAANLDIIDFERAGKVTGTRFAFYKGQGAQLERALINFMLDLHITEHGYTEIFPPFMVHRESMVGTGQLPKFEEDAFRVADTDYFLIPTAEVPVTNLHREEIFTEEDLPKHYVAYSACFRAEAGAHGRDTRGLIRQHQFNKVELVKFARPQDSMQELETLTANAEEILKRLGLPYQTMLMCTADLGFAAAKKYDLEVWLPAYNTYREISSCSNFGDFQARRAGIRFRPAQGGKAEFVHTLNGSGVAVGRTVAAILENYQQEDGTVLIPEPLRPYMPGLKSDYIGK
ncbi:serine--tRNA ligase [Dethiobacter alkaliphilus]|uniref:Serine--tRNA ligase n=1 Tax=Dethiobacter alkaliphilus AHT 1 TaxID=555088 RepID=C0GK96_DETAL|nr:serine--tRNA ligase [Dethiobacter alkaliphilus]EEG76211.1 seryl-tRNA synthetase [Dethiobacter alkaliphilus AHT 1]